MARALVYAPLLLAVSFAASETPQPEGSGWIRLFNGNDLTGWHSIAGWHGEPGHLDEWFNTQQVALQASDPARLEAHSEPGPIILNGIPKHTTNLISERKFGDLEVSVDFMVSRGSNSGVYLAGLYEVQIFDSFSVHRPLTYSDGGGIYERWEHEHGLGGTAPTTNASRAPGHWQNYQIRFRAPRFNPAGKKIENARFLEVMYNGIVVQKNVECPGPTRSALDIAEAPTNPLMLQGDHGPVAFRNLYVRPLQN